MCANESGNFVDGRPDRLEGAVFGLGVVAHRIDGVVVDIDDPLVADELPSFVLLLRHQVRVLARHAAHGLQDPVALARGGGLAVDEHVAALIGDRLVRQQGRHSQGRVRRQDAELRRQLRLEPIPAIELRGKLLRGLETERVADDDERPPIVPFIHPWLDVACKEAMLIGDVFDPPVCEQPVFGFEELSPCEGQRRQVPVRVVGLDRRAKGLDDVPTLGFGAIGGDAEVAVKLIEAEEFRLVVAVHGRGVGVAEPGLVLVPKRVELGGRHRAS